MNDAKIMGYGLLAILLFLLVVYWCVQHDRLAANHRRTLELAGMRTSVPIHVIASITAIPYPRYIGMVCYTTEDGQYWKCTGIEPDVFETITPGPEHVSEAAYAD